MFKKESWQGCFQALEIPETAINSTMWGKPTQECPFRKPATRKLTTGEIVTQYKCEHPHRGVVETINELELGMGFVTICKPARLELRSMQRVIEKITGKEIDLKLPPLPKVFPPERKKRK